MKSSTLTLLLALLLPAAGLLGCAKSQPAPVEATPAEAATAAPTAAEVTFEPAFPADVSADPLTTKDVEQQTTHQGHSHDGGEAHSHEETPGAEGQGDHGHPH